MARTCIGIAALLAVLFIGATAFVGLLEHAGVLAPMRLDAAEQRARPVQRSVVRPTPRASPRAFKL